MTTTSLQNSFRDHPTLGFVDWVLREIGQVVFQNNPISGAVILSGIFYNSWIYGTACLFGTIISTLTALLFRADKGMIKDGLFGFNGALIANRVSCLYKPQLHNRKYSKSPSLPLHCALCSVFEHAFPGLRCHSRTAQGARLDHAVRVGHLVLPRRLIAVCDH